MKNRVRTMEVRVGIGLTMIGFLLAGHCFCQVRPKITSVSHLSVYTSDAAKTEAFYVHDLGAFKGADPQNPMGVRYYFNAIGLTLHWVGGMIVFGTREESAGSGLQCLPPHA